MLVFKEAELVPVEASFDSLVRFLDAARHRHSWKAQVEVEFGARLLVVERIWSFWLPTGQDMYICSRCGL